MTTTLPTARADGRTLIWSKHRPPAGAPGPVWTAAGRWLVRGTDGGAVLVDFAYSPPAQRHVSSATAARRLAYMDPGPVCDLHGATVEVNGARVCARTDCGHVLYWPAPACVADYFLAGWESRDRTSPCCTYPAPMPVLGGRATVVTTCASCGRDYPTTATTPEGTQDL